MTVVLALDAGTTGVRTIAFGPDGRPITSSYREFTQHFPKPAWVEHDAQEIWDVLSETMAEVVETLGDDHGPIAAIGITDQRETVVVWDRVTGEPRHRALVWQDRRTAARCDQLEADGHLPLVRSTTGLVLDPYFSGTKLEWLLTEGGVEADENLAFGTIDSWLLWKLSGGTVHATDTTNASRTLLFDINTLEWSPEMCELLNVPMHVLPEVLPSSGRFTTTAEGLGVPAGIPVSGVAGDQQAALFGQACFSPGMTKNTYGTGSFVLMNVGNTAPPPVDGLLTTVAWTLDAGGSPVTTYALEGAIFVTGAAIQWLRDGLGVISEAAEIGPLAAECDTTDGVYLVPAFAGLGSPWWDPYARGTIVGITRGTGRPQLARAVVEAMAYQTRDVVTAMSGASGHEVEELRIDGGASVMDLLMELQAAQLGVPVTRPVQQETTALGAAYLAGLAEGVWESTDDISARWEVDARVEPEGDRTAADATHSQWLRAVERASQWEPADPNI